MQHSICKLHSICICKFYSTNIYWLRCQLKSPRKFYEVHRLYRSYFNRIFDGEFEEIFKNFQHWKDNRIVWEPKDYGNVRKISRMKGELPAMWFPPIHFTEMQVNSAIILQKNIIRNLLFLIFM